MTDPNRWGGHLRIVAVRFGNGSVRYDVERAYAVWPFGIVGGWSIVSIGHMTKDEAVECADSIATTIQMSRKVLRT
jgi:hypothetical protein